MDKTERDDFLCIRGESAEQMKVLEIANFIDESVDYFHVPGGEFRVSLYLASKQKVIEYSGDLTAEDLAEWTYLNTIKDLVYINSELALRAVF
jgi:hypothetical protein